MKRTQHRKFIFALFILATACVPNNATLQPTPEAHFFIDNPRAKLLWSNSYPAQTLPVQILVAAPDRIIASIYGIKINAFDSKTGKAAWEVWIEETEPTISKMVVQDSIVYTAKYDGLTALDAKTGDLIWDVKNLNTGNALNLLVDQQNIFVQHQNRTGKHLIVVNSSGKVAGTINIPSLPQRIWSIDDNVAYSTNGNSLHAFDIAESRIKWTANIENLNFQQAVIAENIIYLDAEDWRDNETISAVEKNSGNVIWRKETHKNIISNLCILDDNSTFLRRMDS